VARRIPDGTAVNGPVEFKALLVANIDLVDSRTFRAK
jgi:hypothetical protein